MKKDGNSGRRHYLLALGVMSVLAVSGLLVPSQTNHAAETKENKENLTSKSKIDSPGIPPIDKALPSIIETASFGLG